MYSYLVASLILQKGSYVLEFVSAGYICITSHWAEERILVKNVYLKLCPVLSLSSGAAAVEQTVSLWK